MPEHLAQSRPEWWPTNPYHPITSTQWNADRYSAWEQASEAIYVAFKMHTEAEQGGVA